MKRSGFSPKVEVPNWRYGLGLFAALMLFIWHPFSGGARVPSLILFLLGIVFWVTSRRRLFADPAQRRWMLVVIAIGLPMLLSLWGSHAPDRTMLRLLTILAVGIVGSAIIEVSRLPGALRLMRHVLAGLVAIWLIDASVQLLLGRDVLGVPLRNTYPGFRVVGMYRSHLYFAWVLVLMLPLLLWSLLPKRPYLALLSLFVSGLLVMETGIRSAWISWAIVAILFLVHVRFPRKAIVVTALSLVMLVAVPYSPLVKEKLEMFSNFEHPSFEAVNKALSSRLFIWETAWEMFRDNPINGVGGYAFREAYRDYSYRPDDPFGAEEKYAPPHAHQLYISIVAETGLFGFLGVIFLWAMLLRWYFASRGMVREKARPFAIALLAVTFPLNSQPLIFKTWWLPLLVFISAVLVVVLTPRENGDENASGAGEVG